MSSDYWDDSAKMNEFIKKIPTKLLKKKGFVRRSNGRHREGWLTRSGKYIIKFPINDGGVTANQEEADFSCKGEHPELGSNIAKCRLFLYNGLPCLIMERVDRKNINWDNIPDWVRDVDRDSEYQVGYTRKGKLVAYDYSDC